MRKLINATHEIDQLNISVSGINETRWIGSDSFNSGNYTIYCSNIKENTSVEPQLLLIQVCNRHLTSDRIIQLQIESTPSLLNLRVV